MCACKSCYNHCQHDTVAVLQSTVLTFLFCEFGRGVMRLKGDRLKGNLRLALWSKTYHNSPHFRSCGPILAKG